MCSLYNIHNAMFLIHQQLLFLPKLHDQNTWFLITWLQCGSRDHPSLNVKMMDGSRAGLTCGGRASQQCCWQSALQPPNRKWLWYPPWPQGWWTSWWALAASQTWQRCLCRSWLCRKLRPRLVRKRHKQRHTGGQVVDRNPGTTSRK